VTLAAGVTLLVISFSIAMGMNLDWNGAKLAPIVAMVRAEPHGEPLYQDPDTGVMTAWIYGPVPALIFLPAAIASRPTGVIFIGIVINILCTLGAALWAHIRAANTTTIPAHQDTKIMALLMFGVLIWISLTHESLRRAIYIVGPDGPAIGFAVCSTVLLFGRRQNLHLALSALCAVLSCWSKQTMLPFVLAAPIYLLLIDGRAAVRYVLYLLATGAIISIFFFFAFSPRESWFTRHWLHNMWFHMLTVPASHPWQDTESRSRAIRQAVAGLVHDSTEMIVLLLAVLVIAGFGGAFRNLRSNDGLRRWLVENPWVMFLLSGLSLLPMAILGFVKIGGYVNNFALTGFFIALGATVCMVTCWPRIESPALRQLARSLACALIIIRALQILMVEGNVKSMWTRVRHIDQNQQEAIYGYALTNPGTIYFPWNTLPTLLAEKKLYHFEWGLVDRLASPYQPTVQQIQAHLPSQPRAIAFGPMVQSSYSLQIFPYATARLPAHDDLPGFTLVGEPGAQLPQSKRPKTDQPPAPSGGPIRFPK
ncbi:MAG: hypothetical protein H7Z14_01100, partial [Anaerolineae bacterium]|nr:hypothetical protein [Phycisphaerae bacterium]